MDSAGSLLGVGLYTVPEAARLADVDAPRVHRWIRGYDFTQRDGTKSRSEPLFPPDLPILSDSVSLSFADLVELRLVGIFLGQGVSLPAIRRAASHAFELFKVRHPFAVKRFRTDGRTIFAGIEYEGDERLLDLVSDQVVFRQIIEPFLRQLDYHSEAVARWWPLGRERPIVVDPRRAFGQPIVSTTGTPTYVIDGARRAGETIESIASWFELTPAAVEAAVEFEERFAA